MTRGVDHPLTDQVAKWDAKRGAVAVWRGVAFGLWLGGLLCMIGISDLQAGSAPTLTHQIEKEKQALGRIQGDIEKEQARYRVAKEAEERLRGEVEAVAKRSDRERRAVGDLDLKVKTAEAERSALDLKIAQQNRSVEAKKALLAKELRRLYKATSDDPLSALLSPDDKARGAGRRHLAAIARARRDRLAADRRQRSHLSSQKDSVDRTVDHLTDRRDATTKKVTAIQSAQQKAGLRLARAQREAAESRGDLVALNTSAAQMQDILKRLNERKASQPPPQAAGSFASAKGQLVWPNGGKVIGLFGRQKHPKFDTYINRKGIEIARVGKKDAAVRAVYGGVVAYADALRGYGNVVILDHGGDYYSVYGRLQKLKVSTGKRIGKGESIGQVAGAEGHLYFEIRHRSRAQDPLAWLPKRS